MNVKVLERIEKGWIKIDWKDAIQQKKFSIFTLESFIDCINTYKTSRSVKEVVLAKWKNIPAYITCQKNEWYDLLNWIQQEFIQLEMYEKCYEIESIKEKLR